MELRNEEIVEGEADAIPFDVMEEVSSRFANTLYGYFIGKRLAFRLVENYVQNTWAKYGLKCIQLHDDFFLFQIDTKEGMESVLENGLWLIRMMPMILNVWSPNTDLKKADVKKALVWVKLHHVPIVAYSEVGLSLITTQIGKPIMLDSYTSNMCVSSWGRSTYARALIEISADVEMKDSLMIAIPMGRDKGHSLATIDIEYDTKPVGNDGFVEVKRKKNKAKTQAHKQIEGVRLTKAPLKFQYRRVENGDTSKMNEQQSKVIQTKVSTPSVTLNNSFSSLDLDENNDEPISQVVKDSDEALNVSNSEVDEEIVMEDTTKGASTPVDMVISENNLSICAILESHVAVSNLQRMCSLVFCHWDWSSNGALCHKGTRIILGWNHNDVDVIVINQDDQTIYTRVLLKAGLNQHKLYVRDKPWCLMGDFNTALFLADSTASSSNMDISMRDFKDCVANIEVMDMQQSGLQYTRSQKPEGLNGILKKLDRIMANLEEVVQGVWNRQISGFYMFRVVKKMKLLKKPFQKLLYEKGNLHANVIRLRKELDFVQTMLDVDPFNLKEGDSNSAYFHKTVKIRVSRSRTDVVTNMEGTLFENDKVALDMVHEEVWQIVGDDVTNAICEFLQMIIANRIKQSLKDLISPNQSAFIPGRSISDNILQTQELMHNYHLDHGTPRCAFKVDIQKAYDTVDWHFVREVLHGFEFHARMISWIMECVTSTSYSICINVSLHGYFQGKRGLRQGDPLSPLYCSKLELVNLCFADDFFIFSYGDVQSATVIKEALEKFKLVSGLVPSLPKSTAYFCNVLNHIKISILHILPFEEG
ncbi:sugar transport protein 13, partial [Tanacetum coccineum]